MPKTHTCNFRAYFRSSPKGRGLDDPGPAQVHSGAKIMQILAHLHVVLHQILEGTYLVDDKGPNQLPVGFALECGLGVLESDVQGVFSRRSDGGTRIILRYSVSGGGFHSPMALAYPGILQVAEDGRVSLVRTTFVQVAQKSHHTGMLLVVFFDVSALAVRGSQRASAHGRKLIK